MQGDANCKTETGSLSVERVEQSSEQRAVRTFLIADVRGYTAYTVEHGDEAAAAATARFATLVRAAAVERGGEVIELRGDEALAVFSSTRQALWAAAEMQVRFATALRDDPLLPLRVGIGLDAGDAVPVEGGYRGAALNRAARLCSLARPGEVLASDGVIHLAGRTQGLTFVERGSVPLKGFAEPVRVFCVELEGTPLDAARPGEIPLAGQREQALPIGGFLGSISAGTLVSREREVQTALGVVSAVEAGGGRLIALPGEAGVGKTRLAQEITLHLRDRGFLIAAGSCYEARQTSGYFPFLEAIAALYSLAPAALRSQVPQRWPYLAALLPTENLPVPPVSSAVGSQDRVLWSVSGFLQALAEEQPVAILLDDLHWADSSTLELLQHLAHQTRRDQVLILVTYRDNEVGRHHPLEATLRELDRQDLMERVPVRRLPPDGASALIAAVFEGEEVNSEFADLLYRRTEGNPFFLQQVLRDLVERGDMYSDDDGWHRKALADLHVPESIRSAVGQRLGKLSDGTREVLYDASVLGQTFLFDDLQAMSERDEDEIESALEEAMRAALVGDLDGERYAFDHALTQQSLYGDLPARRRKRLHRAAGEAVEELPPAARRPRSPELARHFLLAGDSAKALSYSLQAGEVAAAMYAHADAELQYRKALELAQEREDRPHEALALERLAEVLYITSRFTEQIEVTDRAAALYEELGDLEGEGRVVARAGRAYLGLDRKKEGIERLVELSRRFSGRPASPALFALYENLVTLYFLSGMEAEVAAASERCLQIAQELGDAGIMARAWGRRALGLHDDAAEGGPAERANLEAIRLAEEAVDLDALYLALTNTAVMYSQRGDVDRARRYGNRLLDVTRRLGSPVALARALGVAGTRMDEEGDLAGWRDAFDELILIAGRTSLPALSGSFRHTANLLMAEGKPEEARTYLQGCMADGERTGDALLTQGARWSLADLDYLEGRLPAARTTWQRESRTPDLDPQVRYPHLIALAATLLEIGSPEATEEARECVDELLASDMVADTAVLRLPVCALSGWLALRSGGRDEAVRLLEESLDSLRAHQLVMQEGRVLTWYALMLKEMGENRVARERLTDAIDLYRRVGHVMEQRRAERLLAEIGV